MKKQRTQRTPDQNRSKYSLDGQQLRALRNAKNRKGDEPFTREEVRGLARKYGKSAKTIMQSLVNFGAVVGVEAPKAQTTPKPERETLGLAVKAKGQEPVKKKEEVKAGDVKGDSEFRKELNLVKARLQNKEAELNRREMTLERREAEMERKAEGDAEASGALEELAEELYAEVERLNGEVQRLVAEVGEAEAASEEWRKVVERIAEKVKGAREVKVEIVRREVAARAEPVAEPATPRVPKGMEVY